MSMPAHATPLADPPIPRQSNSYLWIAAGSILIALMYAPVVRDLVLDWWNQETASQGLLIAPLAIAVAWSRRAYLFRTPASCQVGGLAVVVLGCLTYSVGIAAGEFFLTRISLIILLAGILYTFRGKQALMRLSFPMILLATAVPLPTLVYNSMAGPLQLFASDIAARVAQGFGVSVYRDGNVINLAHLSLGVEEACSGLNSLSAMFASAILLGFLFCKRGVSRVILLVISPVIAIAANVVRVAGTAILADYNEQLAKGFYHTLAGWMVFAVGFSLLLIITKSLALIESRKPAPSIALKTGAGAPTLVAEN